MNEVFQVFVKEEANALWEYELLDVTFSDE